MTLIRLLGWLLASLLVILLLAVCLTPRTLDDDDIRDHYDW